MFSRTEDTSYAIAVLEYIMQLNVSYKIFFQIYKQFVNEQWSTVLIIEKKDL